MTHPFKVEDSEIASLFYLKDDKKIADYLGVAVERVSAVRAKRVPKHDPVPEPVAVVPAPPPAPATVALPEPLEEAMAAPPLTPENVYAPKLCPTCGAPLEQRLMISHIQALVAAYYQVPVRSMVSAQRSRQFAHPRQIAMYLSSELTPKSLPDIGRRFSRDHTTVIHAIRAVQKRMLEDAEIEADIKALRERLAA